MQKLILSVSAIILMLSVQLNAEAAKNDINDPLLQIVRRALTELNEESKPIAARQGELKEYEKRLDNFNKKEEPTPIMVTPVDENGNLESSNVEVYEEEIVEEDFNMDISVDVESTEIIKKEDIKPGSYEYLLMEYYELGDKIELAMLAMELARVYTTDEQMATISELAVNKGGIKLIDILKEMKANGSKDDELTDVAKECIYILLGTL